MRRAGPKQRTATTAHPPGTEGPDRVDLLIERLGAEGDGVASHPATSRTVHVVGAIPGEHIRGEGMPGRAYRPVELLRASPDRVQPSCGHAALCGGCTLQHLARDAQRAWKAGRVEGALLEAGHAPHALLPTVETPLRSRRRMDVAYARGQAGLTLGLHVRGSGDIVDLRECHVLHPALFGLLAGLREVLPGLELTGGRGSVVATRLDRGIDLLLRSRREPGTRDRARLAEFAASHDIARVAWQHEEKRRRAAPELLAQIAPASITLGDAVVTPPPGAFLQATESGEQAIVAEVIASLGGLRPRARIVELYAGIGTLTFPLSRLARVRAVEGDGAALAALAKAVAGRPIEPVQRDLARAPLASAEFRGVDAVVLDPPYDGAGAQIVNVAASRVPRIVLVSCNPASLRREAAVLGAAGYRLERARAIDQFLFSARIESVSAFRLD